MIQKIIGAAAVIALIVGTALYVRFVSTDIEIAKSAIKASNYAEAVDRLSRLLEREPSNAEAHLYLGVAYGKKGDYESAFREFDWVNAKDPAFRAAASTHNDIAMLYYLREMYREAIAEFKKAISVNPKFIEAYFNLGTAYSALGDTKNAIDSYREVIRLDPKNSYSHWNLGINLEKTGDIEAAIHHWKKYIEHTPGVFRHPEIESHIVELEKQMRTKRGTR